MRRRAGAHLRPRVHRRGRAGPARPPRPPSAGRTGRRRRRPRTGRSTRCAAIRSGVRRWSWRCSTPSCAPPIARWHRGSARPPPRSRSGAALGLHDDIDDLLAEADAALAAGAVRLRVKIAPGRAAEPVRALRAPRRPRRDPAGRRQRLLHRGRPRARPRSTTSAWPASSSRSPPDDLLGHARLAARLAHADLPRRAAHVARRDRGGRSRSAPARSSASSPPGSAAGSRRARCTTAARSSGCRCGSAGCSRPGSAAPRTWPSRRSPTWPCRRTSIHAVASTPTSPTRAGRSTAGGGAHRARHRRRPRRRRPWPPPRSWEPGRRERARRHHRRRPRRRRAHRRRGGAHAERSVAHAVGGARHRDRREVREPPVHGGVQGARRPQQAPAR